MCGAGGPHASPPLNARAATILLPLQAAAAHTTRMPLMSLMP